MKKPLALIISLLLISIYQVQESKNEQRNPSTALALKQPRSGSESQVEDTGNGGEGDRKKHSLTKRNYAEEESVICIWDCIKQNTTNLLLFTNPGIGEQPDAKVTKFSSSKDLRNSGFNPKWRTYILVHGFRGSGLARQHWAVDIKDLILDRSRANVFYADWSHHARTLSYTRALDRIAEIAEDLYTILSNYKVTFPQFKVNEVHVIGHSLGGHIGGLLGQLMNGELDQITALDPPGFLLTTVEPNVKLSQDDAKYVIAYHTDSDRFGTRMVLADRDVFFNGGSQQPNCASLLPSLCDHRQATKLSSTYMGSCMMVAYLCSNYSSYLAGECGFCQANSSGCAGVGHEWQYDMGTRASATSLRPPDTKKKKLIGDVPWVEGQFGPSYFIKTNADSPYCMFTYQVVVVFGNGSNLQEVGAFDMVLRASGVTGRLRLRVHRHNPSLGTVANINIDGNNNNLRPKFEVFTGKGNGRQLVSGVYLFTGLAHIDSTNSMYIMLPAKFTEALLPGSLRGKSVPATASTNSRQDEADIGAGTGTGTGTRVFVNFMSHVRFEERALNSGPVDISWTSGSQQNDRMKSAASSTSGTRAAGNGATSHQQYDSIRPVEPHDT